MGRRLGLAMAGALLASAACTVSTAQVRAPSASAGGAQAAPHGFGISGSVGGLFPGAHRALVLKVTNHHGFAIVVRSVSVLVGAGGHGCPAGNLTVAGFSGAAPVPARGSGNITLPVTLSPNAGDACQGAVFPLTYSASATAA